MAGIILIMMLFSRASKLSQLVPLLPFSRFSLASNGRLPQAFDPTRSKYSKSPAKPVNQARAVNKQNEVVIEAEPTGKVPDYLKDDYKYKELVNQSFELQNPEVKKAEHREEKKAQKEAEKDKKFREKMGGKHASTAQIATKLDT